MREAHPKPSITTEQGDTIIELLKEIHSELSEVKDHSRSAANSLSSIADDVGEIERK